MDKQKSLLLDAYARKMIALGKLIIIESQNRIKDTKFVYTIDDIDNIYIEIGKYIDPNDPKVVYSNLWHAYLNEQYGRMTKILQKIYEEKPQRDVLDELQFVVNELKWDHIYDAIQKKIIFDFPNGYRLF